MEHTAEYFETHNKPGTKGIKVYILEDTKPKIQNQKAEVIISDETIRSRLKAKPDNDLSRKLFAPSASANLRYTLGAMSDEQFEAFKKNREDKFLKILLGGK